MKKILFLFILFLIQSCVLKKEVVDITSTKENTETIIKDDLSNNNLDNLDSIKIESQSNIDINSNVSISNIDKNDLKIESHKIKTNLKIIDKSKSNVSDTNSGWISYSVPENMKVAKSYSIKVRVSKKTNGQSKAVLILGDDDPINNPEYPSLATIDDIKVSGEMSAELRGDSDVFTIKSLSTQVQNIDDVSYTEWEWVVTPKMSGDSPLKLVIKIKDFKKDIVVFNKTIKVNTNATVIVESFFDKYWQWLFTTVIIPIFVWYWNRKRRKDD